MRNHVAIAAVLLTLFCCSCQHGRQESQTSTEKIRVMISGWVERPGFYDLDSTATLETATRVSGGWSVHTDVERLRTIRLIRQSAGQTNELKFRVRDTALDTIHLSDGDELRYTAVLW